MRDSQSKYVITPDELHQKNTDPEYVIPVANQEILEQLLTSAEETLVDEYSNVRAKASTRLSLNHDFKCDGEHKAPSAQSKMCSAVA